MAEYTSDSMNRGDARTIDRPVSQVYVSVGTVIVVPDQVDGRPDTTILLTAGNTANVPDVPVILFAIEGSNYGVQFTDVPVAELTDEPINAAEPAVRGDTDDDGKQTGSYESRTVKELRELAKSKDIDGYSQLDKADLIEAIRNA